jgi:hypothetical protein
MVYLFLTKTLYTFIFENIQEKNQHGFSLKPYGPWFPLSEIFFEINPL